MGAGSFTRYAAVLSACALGFCVLTAAVVVYSTIASGIGGKALPSALDGLVSSSGLVAAAAHFLIAWIGLHIALAILWAWIVTPLFRTTGGVFLSFLPILAGLLVANGWLYPDSRFAINGMDGVYGAVTAALSLSYALIVMVAGGLRRSPRAVLMVTSVVLGLSIWVGYPTSPAPGGDREFPDIIFIGIDGLRPDHVSAELMPTVHDLLAGGVQFNDAWTPLARTFPAWVSVLTGQYPATHGAIFNLVSRSSVDDAESLPHQLEALGYHRVHAIDETRFSNIDESYGFDRLVGPAIGAFDFMSSIVSDLPAVNLVANTRAGKWLFPYSHSNRALDVSYRPETFDRALRSAVEHSPRERPLFLVAHFELPHWPFDWAGSRRFVDPAASEQDERSPSKYRRALARADAQVRSLIDALEKSGRLDDAALVVLSDHGEAFIGHEPRWAGEARTAIDVHAGHGTHVLSGNQYRVVLGLRGYGARMALGEPREIASTVSLVDVRATLSDWLPIPPPGRPQDGKSFWPFIVDAGLPAETRPVFLETGFSPPSVVVGEPDVAALVAQSAVYYDVDTRGRLSLRPELVLELAATKQFAAVTGNWILAALPDPSHPYARLVIGDLAARRYWDIDGILPPGVPLAALLEDLCDAVRDRAMAINECM